MRQGWNIDTSPEHQVSVMLNGNAIDLCNVGEEPWGVTVTLDVEQAREVVNALNEAIAMIEARKR